MTTFDEADVLLVIDMQNSFLHPDGAMRRHRGRYLVEIDRTIEANRKAVATAREHALPIVYTRHCYRRGYVDAGARTLRLFDSMRATPLIAGTWDAELVDELRADETDVVVDKTRMDAFHQTDLEVVLHGLGASRILMTGIVTNACVETTTRSAAMRDMEVTVLGDCCTTYSAEHQANALTALEYYGFAQVSTVDAVAAAG